MKYVLCLRVILSAVLKSSEYRVHCNAAALFFIMFCNERGKLPSLYTKVRTNYVFLFVPSDNILGVFDVSLSIRLSHT